MNIKIPHLLFEKDKFNPNSLESIDGYAEESVNLLKNDEIIQFERFGFVRIEKTDDKIKGFFTHK
jgi:glutamyl-tRNA synthetase